MKDNDLEIEREKYNKTLCLRNKSHLIVACHLPTYGIGYRGDLLYNIKKDLINFMNITKNNIVVMGRGTWDSLPRKPLKNRINIILSENNWYTLSDEVKNFNNTVVIKNFKLLFEYLKQTGGNKKIYYIGGEQIYKTVVENDLIESMLITEITDDSKTLENIDTFFNYSDFSEYKLNYRSEYYNDEQIKYSFTEYIRDI